MLISLIIIGTIIIALMIILLMADTIVDLIDNSMDNRNNKNEGERK